VITVRAPRADWRDAAPEPGRAEHCDAGRDPDPPAARPDAREDAREPAVDIQIGR
jgi:hypothetical protein